MYHVFGNGLTEKYLLPYNEKIWKTPPEQMSPRVGRSRAAPAAARPHQDGGRASRPRATRTSSTSITPKVAASSRFRARSRRSIGAEGHDGVPRRSDLLPVDGGWAVVSASGEERRYRQLVATIPITTPLRRARRRARAEVRRGARAPIQFAARRARRRERDDLPAYTALYVPDPASLYHRVCYNQVFSPDNGARRGATRFPARSPWRRAATSTGGSDQLLLDRVVERSGARRDPRPDDVVYRAVHREKYAYVIYDLGYSQRVSIVRDYTERRGIHLAGRFAEYRYVNTDACVRRALDSRGSSAAATSRRRRASRILRRRGRAWLSATSRR